MEHAAKTVSQSKTEQVQIVRPEHISSGGRLFGGRLMEWIDVVAGVVARRHTGGIVTTAAVDTLNFKAPAFVEDLIVLQGQLTYVGRTSMEVRVKVFVENRDGERNLINRAYLVMVAMDESGQPIEVPRLTTETEEDRREWDAGEKRHALRRQRRVEKF